MHCYGMFDIVTFRHCYVRLPRGSIKDLTGWGLRLLKICMTDGIHMYSGGKKKNCFIKK